MVRFVLISAFVLSVSGCVTSGEYLALKNDVNQLKRDYYAHDRALSVMKKDFETVKGSSQRSVGQESFDAIRESQAEISSQVLTLHKELQMLQGRFDENKFFVEKSLKDNTLEIEVIRSRIEQLERNAAEVKTTLSRMEETLKRQSALASDEKDRKEKVKESDKDKAVGAKGLYEKAQESYKKRDYRKAREKFSEFLKTYPDHELSDNALFWIGETYYRERDFENAIIEYEKLIKSFPKSPKLPSAMIKQALSFESLGDERAAKVVYQLVIQKYPESPEAKKASKKLGAAPSKKKK